MRHTVSLAAIALLSFSLPSQGGAHEPEATLTPEKQFAMIASWEGRWKVQETDALEIVFESTARGTTIVERWETASGLHSMTVYHLNVDVLMATHYCPQGNQPRLETVAGESGTIAFAFRDMTGLDEGESHAFTLEFAKREDGALVRSEVYRSADGPGNPSSYTLIRVQQ